MARRESSFCTNDLVRLWSMKKLLSPLTRKVYRFGEKPDIPVLMESRSGTTEKFDWGGSLAPEIEGCQEKHAEICAGNGGRKAKHISYKLTGRKYSKIRFSRV